MMATEKRTPARLTKADLLRLLEPYGPGEEVVFVTFEDGITVHEEVSVAKDHCTHRVNPDGSISMPVAIYLVDDGKRGEPGVMGLDAEGIRRGFERALDAAGERRPSPLDAVLEAAQLLLGARQVDMETVQEWVALARAVAACTVDHQTVDFLTARDLEQAAANPPIPWDDSVDGPLQPEP